MEDSNYLQEAYFSFDDENCRIYIQPNFTVVLQKEDIIDLTKDDIEFSTWFYKSGDDKEECFDKVKNKQLVVKKRIIENNVLIIKVDIL